ncbi:hypothetical protein EX30DRAFT_51293 [Ascodesmis nigricans]|uniref:EH domain-containing protein n=1 Tax=Ascodesmis nigricans TaxID=341454 RepID=A0A4S2MVA9_9PEZI|nr:hypothetical protein EX30DRAFT_51293 [Ascodesmis nigricans]
MPTAPASAALQAATLSFRNSNSASRCPSFPDSTPPSRETHSHSSPTASSPRNNHLLPPNRLTWRPDSGGGDAQWTATRTATTPTERSRSGSPAKSSSSRASHQSASSVAANLAFSRSPATSPIPPMTEEVLPAGGTVSSRLKMFQEGGGDEQRGRERFSGPPPVHQISPERSRPGSPAKTSADGGVDSTSVDGIGALRNMFERGRKPSASPAIHAPSPILAHKQENISLTAAVLATQLSPPGSTATSRCGSPDRSGSVSAPSSSTGNVARKRAPPPIKKKPSLSGSAVQLKSKEPSSPSIPASPAPTRKPALAPSTPPKPPPPRKINLQETSSIRVPSPIPQGLGVAQSTPTKAPAPPPPRASTVSRPSPSIPLKQPPPTPFPTPPVTKKPLPGPTVSSIPTRSPLPPPRATPPTELPSSNLPSTSTAPPPPAPRRTVASDNSTPNLPPPPSPTISAVQSADTGSSFYLVPDSATIAASLAPSRTLTPGPRKTPVPEPPPSRRQGRSSESPNRHLRSTLRDSKKDRKSPSPPPSLLNKLKHHSHHNEAKNPIYIAKITERQRKRYEGLWAANRGLLGVAPNGVHGYVVRDIWGRSRLESRVLAEIWGLVDREGKGWLQREEMVVGTWLVDQSLHGKKVPVKVQNSVWDSVRRINRGR